MTCMVLYISDSLDVKWGFLSCEEKKNEKQTIHVGRHVATQVDPPCKFKAKYKYAMPYVRRRDAGGKHVYVRVKS